MTITLDGSGGMTAPSGTVYNGLDFGTAVSASGTSILFTGIPLWAKRVTVMFSGVIKSGSSNGLIQLGSGTLKTSGYNAQYAIFFGTSTPGAGTSTTGIPFITNSGATVNGTIRFENISGNTWVASGNTGLNASGGPFLTISTGTGTLSGVLDRLAITSVNGTDTYSAGTLNTIYE